MTSKPSDDLLTRCRELLENRQMNDSSSPALCALADTFHPAIPPHVRLSMAELKTHREAMRTLLDNAQQPSGEVTDTERLDWLAWTGIAIRNDPASGRWYLKAPYHTRIACVDDFERFDTFRAAIDAARAREGRTST
ncbi:hypothetical protein QZL91_15980 [Burkholderia multivorans]|nr:hypothetical protein [Burkholderia multivorans]